MWKNTDAHKRQGGKEGEISRNGKLLESLHDGLALFFVLSLFLLVSQLVSFIMSL